jgi:uncharacterized protein (DUF1697 family)
MPHYVALLRSVNVAGHGRISMADLTQTFLTLGYTDVATYIQTGNVLFRSQQGADPSRHHVTFLATPPSKERLAAFTAPPSGRDELTIVGQEVYVHTPDGYAGTKLTGTLLERRLGVLSTTRNWNTVTKLHALALARS